MHNIKYDKTDRSVSEQCYPEVPNDSPRPVHGINQNCKKTLRSPALDISITGMTQQSFLAVSIKAACFFLNFCKYEMEAARIAVVKFPCSSHCRQNVRFEEQQSSLLHRDLLGL